MVAHKDDMLDIVLIDDTGNAVNEVLIQSEILLSKEVEEASLHLADNQPRQETNKLPMYTLGKDTYDALMVHFNAPLVHVGHRRETAQRQEL